MKNIIMFMIGFTVMSIIMVVASYANDKLFTVNSALSVGEIKAQNELDRCADSCRNYGGIKVFATYGEKMDGGLIKCQCLSN